MRGGVRLAGDGRAAGRGVDQAARPRPDAPDPLAPRPPHFPPRAKRIIFLFMSGGPSQVDTFDYKPLLQRDDGKPLPFAKPRVQFNGTGTLLGSPWKFRQYGQSGSWVSELFPHVARCVDDLCFIHSLHGTNAAHGGAVLKLHTGSDNFVRPSMGSWVTYGLGTENANLPGFITICPTLAFGGVKNWGSAFLPAPYQGTPLGNASVPAEKARVSYIKNPHVSPRLQRLQLDLLAEMNRDHLSQDGPGPGPGGAAGVVRAGLPDADRDARDRGHLRRVAGDAQGLRPGRPRHRQLRPPVPARPPVRRAGVRFVQVTHSDSVVQWDQHSDLKKGHEKNAREVDKPIAGLLEDLKARGLLDDTLVLWGGEFGRTPTAEGQGRPRPQPRGLHHVAGRRRRQGRASSTAPPTTTATSPSRTRCTSTTCTRRSST